MNDERTWQGVELATYMQMYRSDSYKREDLALRVAKALPDIHRDLENTLILTKFYAWLRSNGVALPEPVQEPAQDKQAATWGEIFGLLLLLARRCFWIVRYNPKEALRLLVWRVLGFSSYSV